MVPGDLIELDRSLLDPTDGPVAITDIPDPLYQATLKVEEMPRNVGWFGREDLMLVVNVTPAHVLGIVRGRLGWISREWVRTPRELA